jgi:eukaryotic-like serine/threonine-protein kinase
MTDCLDDEAIANLSAEALTDEERAALIAHIDVCDACRSLVADAVRGDGTTPAPRRPGAALGRYVILETVGAGAMGVVYAAYDPELGRKIALKVLRTDPFAQGSSNAQRGRLLREAQALAKLSHPNVITIHDVGVLDGDVFLAMELIEEGTLGDWLRAAPRRWRAVLVLMRQAGEGLAAAHAAGLVHRDFKPENVLVDAEGRPRVTDFGLARAQAGEDAVTIDAGSRATDDDKLTRTGALIGTPAYMAPELLAGLVADERSDQYGFSATLYEALYGQRPFEGTDVASLVSAITRGQVRGEPVGIQVPAWLRRIVVRGLRADPTERFPSMRALLGALAKGPLLSPRRMALAATACLLVAVGGLAAGLRSPASPPPCTGDEAAWGDVFGPKDEDAVHRAFASTKQPSAELAFASLERGLGTYRSAWTAMHHDACVATRVRRTQSDAMLDRRMACLESRRKEAAALVAVFAAADDRTVTSTQAAVDALPPVSTCAETPELLAKDPPPKAPEKRAMLARLDGEVMRALALHEAYKWPECLEVIAAMLPAAEALGYRPLEARANLVRGLCQMRAAPRVPALAYLHDAARFAISSHDDASAADAWIALIHAYRMTLNPAGAEEYGRYAGAAIARLGGDDEREATRLEHLSEVAVALRGRPDEAERYARRARELLGKLHGPDDYRVAYAEECLADALRAEDRLDECFALDRHIQATRTKTFGPESPALLIGLFNSGESLDLAGRSEEAIALYRDAFARWPVFELGYAHYAHTVLARALRHAGRYEEALAEDREALVFMRKQEEVEEDAAEPLAGQGLDELALGHAREAVPFLEAALRVNGDYDTGDARFGLAQALWDSGGDRRRARDSAVRASEDLRERAERYGGRFRKQRDTVEAWLASRR